MFRDAGGRSTLLLLLVVAAIIVAIGSLAVGFIAVRSLSQAVDVTVPPHTVAATDPAPPVSPTVAQRKTPLASSPSSSPSAPAEASSVPGTVAPPPFIQGPFTYGTSFGGRDLVAYRLGSGPSTRAIIGGIHGGYEWNTVELVSRTLEYLRDNPTIVPSEVTLYLIPCANPDGYAAGTDPETGRTNDNNVDLNGNWDYRWQPTARHGRRPVDAGSQPFSEPETAALRDLILDRGIEAGIFYHSAMARVFYGAETEKSASYDLAQVISEATGYPIATGVPGQITTGDAVDWMSDQGLAGVEVELTTHEDIDWEQNRRGLEAFLSWGIPATPSAPAVVVETAQIGESVEGRPIEVTQIGAGTRVGLVVMGSIHGDEPNTEALVRGLMEGVLAAPETVPAELSLYFLPSINPDGLAAGTRQNANGVDLNRNWPTDDWQSDAARTNGVVPGSGGSAPGSEPEVQALGAWLLETVQPSVDEVWLLSYHAAYPPRGAVQPGYSVPGTPGSEAAQLAQRVVDISGYTYLATWPSEVPFSGELIHWCDVHGIRAVDIELPSAEFPDTLSSGASETFLETHQRVLAELLGTFTNDDATAEPGDTIEIVVEAGSTLSQIAYEYGVSVDELIDLNGLSNADEIQIGQRLRVPVR